MVRARKVWRSGYCRHVRSLGDFGLICSLFPTTTIHSTAFPTLSRPASAPHRTSQITSPPIPPYFPDLSCLLKSLVPQTHRPSSCTPSAPTRLLITDLLRAAHVHNYIDTRPIAHSGHRQHAASSSEASSAQRVSHAVDIYALAAAHTTGSGASFHTALGITLIINALCIVDPSFSSCPTCALG